MLIGFGGTCFGRKLADPEKLRKHAIGIGQVLKMEMFPEDRVKPKQGKDSKPKRFVIIGQTDDGGVLAALFGEHADQ